MTLLDSDVLIDLQRGHPPAVAWLQGELDASFCIPGLAAIEFLAGSRNRSELEKANWYLTAMSVIPVDTDDFDLAIDLVRQLVIRSGLSLPDYFIAAQAVIRSATLLSFNGRHFGHVAGLRVVEPYVR